MCVFVCTCLVCVCASVWVWLYLDFCLELGVTPKRKKEVLALRLQSNLFLNFSKTYKIPQELSIAHVDMPLSKNICEIHYFAPVESRHVRAWDNIPPLQLPYSMVLLAASLKSPNTRQKLQSIDRAQFYQNTQIKKKCERGRPEFIVVWCMCAHD